MTLRLQICYDLGGSWGVHGLSAQSATHLPSLSASVDYARRECQGAPATIELMVDGFYAVVHQENGWPRQLVAPEAEPLWARRWWRRPFPLQPVVRLGNGKAVRMSAAYSQEATSAARSWSSRFIASRACATRLMTAPASGFAATKRSKSAFRSTSSRQ